MMMVMMMMMMMMLMMMMMMMIMMIMMINGDKKAGENCKKVLQKKNKNMTSYNNHDCSP